MKTVGIVGGTGFTGKYITALLLKKGYAVVVFTRNARLKSIIPNLTYAMWDATHRTCDTEALKTIDVAIHLAGAGIADKRWTDERKQEILDSRVKSTEFLVNQLQLHAPFCKTFIAASAIGFYGADKHPGHPFTEEAGAYPDFLGDTCKKWEEASAEASSFLRTVILRFGIVLGKESGAFPQLAAPMNFGVMPILGSGDQIVSWIHVADIANMVLFAIEHETVKGIYNAVAPNPVTHKELMKTIARLKGGFKIPAPAPSFLLQIMLGELSIEVLKSCTVSAAKIEAVGFKFEFPVIETAVKAILAQKEA